MMEAPLVQLPGTRTILDAERYIEMVEPIPADGGNFTLKSRIVGVHKASDSQWSSAAISRHQPPSAAISRHQPTYHAHQFSHHASLTCREAKVA